MQQRAINDFTIRVATVNGSGSQSSNLVLTNAIFRLGIPVAPKNVFPSNIEGLPTWFDVRVSVRRAISAARVTSTCLSRSTPRRGRPTSPA